MGSVPNWYQIGKKKCYISKNLHIFHRKRPSMLTCSKVLSLPRTCVIYRPDEHNPKDGGDPVELNSECLEMQRISSSLGKLYYLSASRRSY